jgi:hypothetical protein
MLRKLLLAGVCLSGIGASVTALAQSYEFRSTVEGLVSKAPPPTGSATSSCKSILDNGNSVGNGIYTIQPASSAESFEVYCDMTSAGGGWTLVVAQLEMDPVENWGEGLQADYDPTLSARKGFALNSGEVPEHSQAAFGKELNPVFIDYFDFTYSTGNIPITLVEGKLSGKSYQIHRNYSSGFSRGDPENTGTNLYAWNNTLTADETGGPKYSWAFGPRHPTPGYRGYAMNTGDYQLTPEYYAWTVWVR